MDRKSIYLEALTSLKPNVLPSPVTREEFLLYALVTGDEKRIPIPITRFEIYLKQLVDSGWVGSSDGGFKCVKADCGYYEMVNFVYIPIPFRILPIGMVSLPEAKFFDEGKPFYAYMPTLIGEIKNEWNNTKK